MGEHDPVVHPGGLNLFRRPPKIQKPPSPQKFDEEVKKDKSAPLSKQPAMKAIFSALRSAAAAAKKEPSAILNDVFKVVKTAGEGPTTSQVAKALDVDTSPWEDPDTHPILLMRDLTRMFGTDWLSWEPETIWSEIRHEDSVDLPRVTKDKVMALRTAIRTDFPWKRLDVFENVALAFAGLVPRFDVMQPLEPYQIALAIDTLYRIHPGIDYSDEVKGYIAATLVHDGLSWAPPEFFGDIEEQMQMLRHPGTVAERVRLKWGNGAFGSGDESENSQLQTLDAIKKYLKGMNEQLDITDPLPVQEYDAEADPTLPSPSASGISVPAGAEA